ncbi:MULTISPECIES: hypothetical protein [unclassified Blastococcus]
MVTVETREASPADAPPARRRGWRPGADLWWALPGALIGAVVIWIAHRGLVDDAYISLDYVRNLARDLHWGMIPTETSNTATSPLNIIVLALATKAVELVTGDVRPVLALGIVTVLLSAAMAVWTAQVARRLGIAASWSLAVVVLVFANPFVNSSLGLEVLLIASLLTGLLAQAVRGSRVGFGVLAGLVVLARLDVGVIVAAVYLLTPALRRRWWVAPLTAVAVALPWFVFSWFALGSAIPASFVIKTLQRSFGDITFANGWWELWTADGTGLAVSLAVVPALLGVLATVVMLAAAAARRLPAHLWPLAGMGVGGAAHFAAYCYLHVPPYHWYYVPSTVALGLTAVLSAGVFLRRLVRDRGPVLLGHALAGAAAVAVAVLAVVSFGGRSLPWTHPVVFGNWAYPLDYLAVGVEIGEIVGDATVAAPPEIGATAFGCDCSMVDQFSDPGRTLPLIQQRIDEAGPLTRLVLKVNFVHLDWEQTPREVDYRVVFVTGPAPEGVPSWTTESPGGPGTMYLERVVD